LSALATIMDEMATAIRTALAGADEDYQVEGRMILNPTTPSIDVYPGDPSRGDDSAGFVDLNGEHIFTVRARVSTNDHEANQNILIDLMDDENDLCIAAALEDDPTLNGHASSVFVRQVTGYVLYPTLDGAGVHIGCQWTVEVIPARS
jgi:hypothetical protein